MSGVDYMRINKYYILFFIFSILGFSFFNMFNKQEEELIIYTSVMEEQAIAVLDEFQREYGVKTKFIRMSSGEILEKLKEEKDDMKASVWYGGTADTFIAAKNYNLIKKYKSKNWDDIPLQFKDEEGYWTGVYIGYLGFIANRDWLNKNSLDMPLSWFDLLSPEYEGNIILSNPKTSGTAYTTIFTLIQLFGEEKGLNYLDKLDKQVKKYTKSGLTPGMIVGLNEQGIAVTFLNNVVRYETEGYKNLVMAVPKEGTGYEIGCVALLNDCKNEENAKAFIDFSLTKKAQEIGVKVGSYQFPTNVDAKKTKALKNLDNINLIDYDFYEGGQKRSYYIKKFEELKTELLH